MRSAAAFAVHLLTASGAAWALLALLAATRSDWVWMFLWLAVAAIVDGIDGPLARRFDVGRVLPRWSGDSLDLVVDFLTYVFVPAYALVVAGLLPPLVAPVLGIVIVVSAALYFADSEMKTEGNYFRGFPGLWNVVAFYLFALQMPPWLAALAVIVFIIATFLPFKFVHPMRVRRWRSVTLAALALWLVLAAAVVARRFEPEPWLAAGLVMIAIYIFAVGFTDKRNA
jgi:phosphatidylcholine synthase